jgi:DNA-directed RNA polymerase specialized sigma24 family protein
VIDLDLHLPDIAAGDRAAFAAWLAGAERPLRNALRSFAAWVDVEAVLQEALLRAWHLAPRLRPDGRPNALLRFAFRAARNLALSELRRRGREAPPGDEEAFQRTLDRLADEGPTPSDPLLRRLILACLELLPPQPRAALLARLSTGGVEPDRALAAGLRMRLNTFLKNVGRARQALADCLRSKGVDLTEERP